MAIRHKLYLRLPKPLQEGATYAIRFAGIGPSGAYVDSVDVEEVEPQDLRGFEVR